MDGVDLSPLALAEGGVRPPRRVYKIAGPRTWGLARELYLAGLPASEVAARLNVSVHNLRKKATREKWSRRAHAELVLDVKLPAIGGDRRSAAAVAAATLGNLEEEAEAGTGAGPPAEADPQDAAETLLRRAAAAALGGKLERAQAMVKLAEGLRRAAGAGSGGGDDGCADAAPEEPEPPMTDAEVAALREELADRNERLSRPVDYGGGYRYVRPSE